MGKHGKFQTTLEYGVTRALLGGLGLLPRPLAVATGRAAGRVAYKFAGGLRRTGETNLRLAFPEMHARERARMLRASFDNLGRLLGEFSQFPRATPESLRKLVEYDEVGLRHRREAEAEGRGVIFLTAHLGAWEFLSFAWSALEYPISFLVRPIDNPRVEDFIESIRTRYGNTAINKKMAARQALRVLRDGGTLGILADLNTHPNEGVFVPFFGHLACTTSGVATLALRTDAVVIPTCAVWDEARGRFFFHGEPPVELVRSGDDRRDIETNTANFTAAIERMIRAYPEQWLWIHKRWRTRPTGEPDFYSREQQFDTKESHLTAPTSRNSFS
ncbi:MAG TPA: lysophospholipid acyltransferase family protein [Pyrinomonadaceae bacterium]|nr:lysophospholipid acyltransferase family protein [Pyrinomonadaceae bacterium]